MSAKAAATLRIARAAMLAGLYPRHQDYFDAVIQSADAAVSAGFLLQADADDIAAAAEDVDIPSLPAGGPRPAVNPESVAHRP
jgi:Alpha/beta hydrolase domain